MSRSFILQDASLYNSRNCFARKGSKAILFVFLMTMSFTKTIAQSPSPESTLFSTSGSFFALSVKNLEESVKWYSEKFGLKVIMQMPPRDKFSVAVLKGNGLIIELIHNDDAQPLETAAPSIKNNILVHGIFKVGIIVNDYNKLLEGLKQKNIPIVLGPFPAKTDQPANLIIKDNSGNMIQFFEN